MIISNGPSDTYFVGENLQRCTFIVGIIYYLCRDVGLCNFLFIF